MDQHNNQDGNYHFPSPHNFKIASTGVPTGGQTLYQSAALQRQTSIIQHSRLGMTSQSLGKRSSMEDPNEQLIHKKPRNINFQQPYFQQMSSGCISNNQPYTSDPGPAQHNIQGYSTLPLMPSGIPGNTPQSSNLQNLPLGIDGPAYQSSYTNSIPPLVKQKFKAPSTSPSPARQPDQPRSSHRSQSTTRPVMSNEPATYSRFSYKECWVKSTEHTACNRAGNGNGTDTPFTSEENELYWILHEELYGPPPARQTPVPSSTCPQYPSKQITSVNTVRQTSVSFSAYPKYPSNHAPNNNLGSHPSLAPQGLAQSSYVNGTDLPHMRPEFQARPLNYSTHNKQQLQISQSTHMGSQANKANPYPEFQQGQLHHITQTPQTTTGQSGHATSQMPKSPCQSDSMAKEEVEPQSKHNPPPHRADTNEPIAHSVKEISPRLLTDTLALIRPPTRAGSHEIQNRQPTQDRASSSTDRQSNVALETQNEWGQQQENYAQQWPAKRAQGLPLAFTPGFRENLKWVYTGFRNDLHSDDTDSCKTLTYPSGTVAGAVKLLNTVWNDEQAYTSELGATMGKWVPK